MASFGGGFRVRYPSLLVIAFATFLGCNGKPEAPGPTEATSQNPEPFEVATQAFDHGDYDLASEITYRLLIENPNEPEITFLAARIEAARRKPALAVELASSISIDEPLGKKAAELCYRQGLLARDNQAATDALADLESIAPQDATWQHERAKLLNLQGRRQEACVVVDQLCQAGLATPEELLSIIRRTESFPVKLPKNTSAEDFFLTSLGVARWYFSKENYVEAITKLELEAGVLETLPAAIAFQGRLLAETQGIEKMPAWHARCTESVKEFGDYWAALGTIFLDRGEYEAATRALLEAIYRNPTDRVCYQRLGRALEALGKADEAAQFRFQGFNIADSERGAEQLTENPNSVSLMKSMAQKLMELHRPFETLAWTARMLPPTAMRESTVINQQRSQLLRNPTALTMAAESAMFGLDRMQFSFDSALEPVFGNQDLVAKKLSQKPKCVSLAGPRLVNVAQSVGLDFQWYHDEVIDLSSIPIYQSVGGGIAVIDHDLDGWPDVYLAQGSGKPPTRPGNKSNVLFRNLGGHFQDVTKYSGTEDFDYSSGQAAGDLNQDGFPDLYIGNLGRNRMLINNGDGTFSESSERIADHAETFTTSVAIADINGDALPDIYEGNYIEMEGGFALPQKGADGREEQPSPLRHFAQSDRWFQNLGDGRFDAQFIDEKIAKPGTSLGVVVTDFNDDGLNEVFVGNDVRANHYLIQDKQNGFRNLADALGCANGFNGAATGCMGIATGDFDRDGLLDLQIANFYDESANLFLQTQSGAFVDAAVRYGLNSLTLPYVGFGTKSIDIDRNGWIDFAVTNGHIFDMTADGEPFKMAPQFLMTTGDRYVEVKVDDPSGYWNNAYLGRAMSTIDFDRNGSTDLLIGHLDAKLALLSNETKTKGRFVQLELVGTKSERDAIGARIVVEAGGEAFSQWIAAGDGYFSSDEPVVEIGLGVVSIIDAVHVHWPSGEKQTFTKLDVDQRYLIVESEPAAFPRQSR